MAKCISIRNLSNRLASFSLKINYVNRLPVDVEHCSDRIEENFLDEPIKPNNVGQP